MENKLMDSERKIEDINEALHLAKLNENDMLSTSQSIYFTNKHLHDNDYRFLELDKYLSETLVEGSSLFVVGDEDENVVICTNSHTYDVTETETSNSLLLVEDLKFRADLDNVAERAVSTVIVKGIFYNYLELTLSKPHLNKLHSLLKKSIYKGPEHESEVNKKHLSSFDELTDVIQASKFELEATLKSMPVVTLQNKIRLLDLEYHFRILSFMLKLIDENSWSLDEIDYEETINSLSDLAPEEIVNGLFELYTEESKTIDGLQLYKYKQSEVCTFLAQVLLYSAGKFNLREFLEVWKESVPEGMVPEEKMLYGIAVIDKNSNPAVIRYFDKNELPEEIIERLSVLFRMKEKWTVAEIAPYIKCLATDKMDVNALLAKYARASTANGVKYYSARYGR